MPGRITAISQQKRQKERVSIYIDGRYGFSLSLWAAAGLKTGDRLSSEKIRNLKTLDEKEKAYQRAAGYLSIRPRSCMEIRRYLKNKGFSPQTIESVVGQLTDYGYLNDNAFARTWIDNRLRNRPRGVFGLSLELKEKGVSEDIIQNALADFDEQAAARAAIAPKLKQWQFLPEIKRRHKIYEFLNRRGFAGSTCRDICDET